jgi:hypothetical protein
MRETYSEGGDHGDTKKGDSGELHLEYSLVAGRTSEDRGVSFVPSAVLIYLIPIILTADLECRNS